MRLLPPPWLALAGTVLLISGCGAVTTAVGERALEVETRMTNTIFLDPVPPEKQTVFVQVKNTSDKPEFDISEGVRAAIASRGYEIVDDPATAHYLLQANVLQVGRTTETAAEKTFSGGFGSAVFGGVIGAAAGRAASTDTSAIIGGALVGAAASALADSFVQDVTYSITTDVQVSERSGEGVIVTETLKQNLDQGEAGSRVLQSTETHDWKRYQTRIMSVANQANLDFDEAAPFLADGVTRSIAGIL